MIKEEYRKDKITRREQFGDVKIWFPEVKSFSELFSEVSFTKENAPRGTQTGISTYFYVGNAGAGYSHSFWAKPSSDLISWIEENMLTNCGVHFKTIIYDDGLALITANHNQIIGDRWLAMIDASTIPPKLTAESRKTFTKIPVPVLTALSNSIIDGNVVRLPGQLERKLYEQVNKILDALGGKWNKKLKGHLFKDDPTEILESAMLTGTIKKPEKFGEFFTPKPLSENVAVLARIEEGMLVLEPEAGQAGLADEISKYTSKERITCFELQEKNVTILKDKGYKVQQADFLSISPTSIFDRVVMNPPFEKQLDIKHVLHAWEFVKPGGLLVSIMSTGFTFRDNKLSADFREFVEEYGFYRENPEGSFKPSGTAVNTVTVILDKPQDFNEGREAA